MLFKKKINRIIDIEKIEKQFNEMKPEDKVSLEKGDFTAMIIAGFLVFTPVVLLIIAGVMGLYYFFALR